MLTCHEDGCTRAPVAIIIVGETDMQPGCDDHMPELMHETRQWAHESEITVATINKPATPGIGDVVRLHTNDGLDGYTGRIVGQHHDQYTVQVDNLGDTYNLNQCTLSELTVVRAFTLDELGSLR